MRNIAVFCSGNGSNFEAILKANKNNRLGFRVALMVCDNPKAFALQRASKHNIPTVLISPKLFESREEYEKFIVRILKSQGIDALVLAGFMRILTPYLIKTYKNRIVNIHPSYLPAFKGAHAIKDAFESRVSTTGVSVHIVTDKLDSGKILKQQKIKISAKDTLESLEKRIHAVEHKLYPQVIAKFVRHLN